MEGMDQTGQRLLVPLKKCRELGRNDKFSHLYRLQASTHFVEI